MLLLLQTAGRTVEVVVEQLTPAAASRWVETSLLLLLLSSDAAAVSLAAL